MERQDGRWVLAVATAAVALLTSDASGQAGLTRTEIDRLSRTVVRIVALEQGQEVSSGSGTVVSATGLIYTNRHVVEDGDDFSIEFLDDVSERPTARYRARVVGFSLDVDFAALQIDRGADGLAVDAAALDLPFLTVGDTSMAWSFDSALGIFRPPGDSDVGRGDHLYVFGYPGIGDGYLTFTEGAVTSTRNGTMGDRRIQVWYQTDAEISPGNSGGLVVSGRSEIVGIPTSVRTEGTTGGRMGGILTISAVRAALDVGLETNLDLIGGGTTSPVIEDGRLDFSQAPYFGSVSLAAGFEPDPHRLELTSGGELNVEYLGGECVGHAAMAPDFRLNWSGTSDQLRIYFVADENGGDTTLLINQPDSTWACNDDGGDGGVDPLVALDTPQQGQYDIWVGSYAAGRFVGGTLYVTERDLGPESGAATRLDVSGNPNFGIATLAAGFEPDPHTTALVAGGSVDVSYLEGDCLGFAATPPDLRLIWSGRSGELRVFFTADGVEDTTLIVNLPGGDWLCNDDSSGTIDPMVVLDQPAEGQYDIWVGSYEPQTLINGTLTVTERQLQP